MTDKVNSLFEPKHFNSNPETEELLWDATELEEGLVVMIEEPSVRADISEVYMDSAVMEQAYRWNRWATVSDLNHDANLDQVLFVATYSDGSKRKLVTSADYAWYVKKNSMPGAPVEIDRNEILYTREVALMQPVHTIPGSPDAQTEVPWATMAPIQNPTDNLGFGWDGENVLGPTSDVALEAAIEAAKRF